MTRVEDNTSPNEPRALPETAAAEQLRELFNDPDQDLALQDVLTERLRAQQAAAVAGWRSINRTPGGKR